MENNRYALEACQLRVATVGTLEDRGLSDNVLHVLNSYVYVVAVSVLIGFEAAVGESIHVVAVSVLSVRFRSGGR